MRYLIGILFLLFVMAGCSSEADMIRTPETTEANKHGLTLNEGKRWIADEETTAGIQDMQLTVERFGTGNDLGSPEAYQELGKTLKVELNTVFRKCTMTGPAHDELHKFLVPVSADIQKLQGTQPEAAMAAYNHLREHLYLYPEFFE